MQRTKRTISNGQEAYREYVCPKVGTVIVPRDKHLTGCWKDINGHSQNCNRMEMFSLLECMRYYVVISRADQDLQEAEIAGRAYCDRHNTTYLKVTMVTGWTCLIWFHDQGELRTQRLVTRTS